MGTRNISISDEAYARLSALKGPNESFTDVINRVAGKRSILELAGVLTDLEGDELRRRVDDLRHKSSERMSSTVERLRKPC
jgi:predicted CopG family antitoxin